MSNQEDMQRGEVYTDGLNEYWIIEIDPSKDLVSFVINPVITVFSKSELKKNVIFKEDIKDFKDIIVKGYKNRLTAAL